MARTPGQRAGVRRAEVVTAARGLLVDRGMGGLTMRALADRLGVRANTLYSHVADKDELIDLVLDQVLTAIEAPDTAATDPRAALEVVMTDTYDLLTAHPDLVPAYLARQGSRGPIAQELGRRMSALLGRLDVPEANRQPAIRVLIVHAIGTAAFGAAPNPADGTPADPKNSADTTISAAPVGISRTVFLDGLRWLLDGATAERSPGPTSPVAREFR